MSLHWITSCFHGTGWNVVGDSVVIFISGISQSTRLNRLWNDHFQGQGVSGGGELRTEGTPVWLVVYFESSAWRMSCSASSKSQLFWNQTTPLVPEPIPSATHRVKLMVNLDPRSIPPNSESCNKMN